MTALRNRLDARAAEVRRAGFLGHWTIIRGEDFYIGTRAPCGAMLRIGLDGDLPVCGEDCPCSADAKRRAKGRQA